MSSFYVILPSNTLIEGNRTNSFTVRLPRTLQFQSDWCVGLTVFVYPHSWPQLGTGEEQWMQVQWLNEAISRMAIPRQSLASPLQLERRIQLLMREGEFKEVQTSAASQINGGPTAPDNVGEETFQIAYDLQAQRFHFTLNPHRISSVEFSSQLAYIMGCEK